MLKAIFYQFRLGHETDNPVADWLELVRAFHWSLEE